MANLDENDEKRFSAAVRRLFRENIMLDIENMTLEQKHALIVFVRKLDQHQANGCECELCKNAEGAILTRLFQVN